MKLPSFYSFISKNSYLLPVGIVGLTLTMLVLTLFPAELLGESQIWSYDKLGHLTLFGTWTYILGLYHHINWESTTKLWVIFIIGVSFGLLIELLQHFLPLNRHGDGIDFLFDMLGCLVAIIALHKTLPDN